MKTLKFEKGKITKIVETTMNFTEDELKVLAVFLEKAEVRDEITEEFLILRKLAKSGILQKHNKYRTWPFHLDESYFTLAKGVSKDDVKKVIGECNDR